MTNSEAKFILSAYRANGRDASEPAFAEALQQASHDPELGAWFARSRAHDSQVSARLASIQPPAQLREAILAGARMGRKPSVSRWAWIPQLAGVAALIAVVFTVVSVRRQKAQAAASQTMASFALADMEHGHHLGAPKDELSKFLFTSGTPLAAGMPVDFERLKAVGCRTLDVGGHTVLEICFNRGGTEAHLYVARASDMGMSPQGPTYVSESNGSAAVWSDSRFVYAVVTDADAGALRRIVQA
jgi:hypothetical protein